MASQRQIELNSKLWDAALYGDSDTLIACISKGADVNHHRPGFIYPTPLHIATFYGRDAVLKILLENNCNIHSVNKYGDTVLHTAAAEGNDSTVELLINSGANPSLLNKNGDTAFHTAAYWGKDSTVQLLINNYGTNPSLPNKYGDTALHRAAYKGNDSTVELLINSGANPSLPNERGDTPLHVASREGYNSIVKLLIKKRADPSIVNIDGKTPQDLTRHASIVKQLHEAERSMEYVLLYKRGMREGYVHLILKPLTLLGPPCVGKTAFLSLLFNLPPPKSHHSTAIISKPVRAMEQIMDANEGKVWTIMDYQKLLLTLSDAIRAVKQSKPGDFPTTYTVYDSFDDQIDSMPPQDMPLEDTATTTTEHISSVSVVDVPSDVPKPKPLPVSNKSHNEIVSLLKKKKKKPTYVQKATWIHVLDSGGQPQFADISRAFVCGNALNVIVMKLTDKLHDKPTFTYSINGKAINIPGELQMTNLQLIEHFVRSIACSRSTAVTIEGKKIVTKPLFIVVGTCLDKIKKSERERLIAEKNAEVLKVLDEFYDQLIFHESSSGELIFAVDNLCWFSRKKISAKIRERIMSQSASIGLETAIPIRWYIYELHLKEQASKEDHGMISLQSCLSIASSLNMDQKDTKACISYLDSLTLCLHYKKLLPNVIFTNPQYLVDLLSNVTRVSFVDRLDDILPVAHSLTSESQQLLREDGIFAESVLDSLCLTFVAGLFDKADFLKLLQYLHIIAPLQSTDSVNRYFFPVVLPPHQLTNEEKVVFKESCEPLVVTFDNKLVPKGLFPTLIVSLLSRTDKPHFFIDSRSKAFPRQLRYAVKLYSEDLFGAVLLVDRFDIIEVYYTGHTDNCFLLRQIILNAVSSSADSLRYDVKIDANVSCTREHIVSINDTRLHPVSISWQRSPPLIGCSVESELCPLELTNERQRCWLLEPVTTTVPIADVLPDGTLNESHLPIILHTLSDLVLSLDVVGIHLGLRNSVIEEIKINNNYQVSTCRKSIFSTWLSSGMATREGLITALKKAKENCLAMKVQSLPTHIC